MVFLEKFSKLHLEKKHPKKNQDEAAEVFDDKKNVWEKTRTQF